MQQCFFNCPTYNSSIEINLTKYIHLNNNTSLSIMFTEMQNDKMIEKIESAMICILEIDLILFEVHNSKFTWYTLGEFHVLIWRMQLHEFLDNFKRFSEQNIFIFVSRWNWEFQFHEWVKWIVLFILILAFNSLVSKVIWRTCMQFMPMQQAFNEVAPMCVDYRCSQFRIMYCLD